MRGFRQQIYTCFFSAGSSTLLDKSIVMKTVLAAILATVLSSYSASIPAGTGVLILQGHKLSMQFHYETNGQAMLDRTQLGLYFSDEPELAEMLSRSISSWLYCLRMRAFQQAAKTLAKLWHK